jgi:phosphopantetheinyl transferase (holo-ACP synthase)
MVGNDVVDLCCADTLPGATHPGFDARVFAPSERAALTSSAAPNRLRWILWAAKESAFKAARQRDRSVVFSPRRFVVSLHDQGRGTVCHRQEAFSISIGLTDAAVHVVATPAGRMAPPVLTALGQVDVDDASAAVRQLAYAVLTPWLGVRRDDLEIVREDRIPRLQRCGQPLPLDISLSHHGRFVAFACAARRNPPLKKI